ncbi:MAG: choice-of-anchor J domain-containing protein [Bacteroidales bacterium]|nr:choice-of-anchor J domain-containing protein [Bacteroidales bacterium]
MKRKTLLIMLLVALFVPLAMNAQNVKLKKSINGSKPKLEVKLADKVTTSSPLVSKLESSKEAALEELNGRGVRAVGDYELVTAAQTDWSGDYVLAYRASNTSATVLTGKATGNNNNYGVGTSVTMSNNTLAASAVSNYNITIAQTTYNNNTVYTLKLGTQYLGLTTNANSLYFATSIPTNNPHSYYWTIAYSGSTLTITNVRYNTRQIKWNSQNNGQRFACYTSGQNAISLFKLNDGCSAPENFAATNVTTNSATFSWTETGASDMWVIFYMAEDDATSSYEIADTNPFTLTGLEPATTYYALVTPYCGDIDQDSDVIMFTTEDLPCPKPTNLNVTAMTPSSATVSWSGEADSYTIQYRVPASNGEAAFSDDFEDAWLDDFGDWTLYTQGDAFSGYGWLAYSPDDLLQSSPGAHSGSVCAMSLSYGSAALNANNYLVTPQVELGGTLKFWIMSNYADEYEVLLSTGGNAIREFTTTLQAMSAAPSSWTEVSIDLSRYEGQRGYIAIHHVMYDGWVLFVDDFGIYGEAEPAGPWVTIPNVTSPYTITGLQGETTYEWQVQGDCGADGESLWSAIGTFTTPTSCGAPSGLTTTNITGTSATLNWAEVLDQYNVTYTKGFVYDFESAEPWAVDSFDPCTTYDGDHTECYGFDGSEFTNFPFTGSTIAFQSQGGNLSSHSGNAFGLMVCPAPTTSSGTPPAANDWFILPEIAIESGDVFSFWAREITTNYGAEVINVGVYGSSQGTFSSYLAQNVQVASTEWEQYSYDLSTYAGQTIRLAINYVSTDIFGFMFDDIFVGNPNWSDPITVTGASYTLEGLTMNTNYVWQVQGVNCDGEGGTTDWSSASFTTLDGIFVTSITADDVTVTIGETASITNLEVLPADATNSAVTYTSNDETIATVTAAGVVTGVGVGETTITIAATDGSNVSYDITVTVNGIDVTGITASDVTVVNGQTATISYTVAPTNATDQSVTFTSADETIATVDADGVVTGVNPGETTITIASVSNPQVTAEITVTVTSNPNAVQFTVNAPANAQPGTVITVEAVLTAPTSGTYGGFNGLTLGIDYDPEAFQFVTGSIVQGPVAQAALQLDENAMVQNFTNINASIRMAIIVPTEGVFVTTEGVVFSAQFTVLAQTGEFTFTAQPNIAGNFNHEADLIPYEATPSTVVISKVYTKDITAWTENGGFYLIASPVSTTPAEVTNMITTPANTYDLYMFNPQVTVANDGHTYEWENYKQHSFPIVPGKGYLYANNNDVQLIFSGTLYDGNGEVELHVGTYSNLGGMNLVGNPFTDIAYIADGREFYTMNSAGSQLEVATGNSIEAMEGVFVNAEDDGETIQFTTTAPQGSKSGVILNVTQGRSNIDRAIVRFDGNSQLPKFQLFENTTKLYIPQGINEFAVVNADAQGELPVNFKAQNNGTYTLSVNAENLEFNYLHLIDNMTGDDVDLLETPSYSFNANTYDYESRFKLVFAQGNSDNNADFAFISDGNLIVNGEGLLQVIDMTGRVISTSQVNGMSSIKLNAAAGVYVLKLNDKTQKIVVK